MRIFNKIIVFFYTLFFSLIGVCLIFIALHLGGRINLSVLFEHVIKYPNLPWIVSLSGILLILVSLSLASISFKKFQSEKTIGYSTGEGQVIISLSAIEDFIRRLTAQMPEVKELRSEVFVTRRGIEIESRVTLWSSSDIPDVTERMQSNIKNQVQKLLAGIEKPVLVNIHVTKIMLQEPEKGRKIKQEIPFLR